MTHGSLFTGIGGFDLAAQWMQWVNIFQVEIDPWCQKLLKQNYPDVQRFTDIREFDGRPFAGQLDVISGGFPCQPYSTAGERKGKEDSRHLWPEMLRIIREIQPRWVVGENVRGLINWNGGMVFDEVQSDLESAGYEVQPFLLPAAGCNAPHQRERIWFIAHTAHFGRQWSRHSRHRRDGLENSGTDAAYANKFNGDVSGFCASGVSFNKAAGILNNTSTYAAHSNDPDNIREPVNGQIQQSGICFEQDDVPNTNGTRWGQLNTPGLAARPGQHTWRAFDCWNEWTTEPPVCGVDDGIPNRIHRIKGLGNAVVPQLVYRIFSTIQHYEQQQ